MLWKDLSREAKSVLEWTTHVWSDEPQVLVIERGKMFVQEVKYTGGVEIFITDELFDEIVRFLPYSKSTVYDINSNVIRVQPKT